MCLFLKSSYLEQTQIIHLFAAAKKFPSNSHTETEF